MGLFQNNRCGDSFLAMVSRVRARVSRARARVSRVKILQRHFSCQNSLKSLNVFEDFSLYMSITAYGEKKLMSFRLFWSGSENLQSHNSMSFAKNLILSSYLLSISMIALRIKEKSSIDYFWFT